VCALTNGKATNVAAMVNTRNVVIIAAVVLFLEHCIFSFLLIFAWLLGYHVAFINFSKLREKYAELNQLAEFCSRTPSNSEKRRYGEVFSGHNY
jgi:hypothetical protein